MEPFRKHQGILAAIDRSNIDTDAIIPKQFLKSIKRTGFEGGLFYDWRYLADGKENPEFSLNQKPFKGASILVAGNNFGCGSSREHAVWAIQQYGFKAVIAPSLKQADGAKVPAFADIFKNNCSKNSLLTIELESSEVKQILDAIRNHPGIQAAVDLEAQTAAVDGKIFKFEIDPGVKNRLLNGLDDIGITLKEEKAISAFEAKHSPQLYK